MEPDLHKESQLPEQEVPVKTRRWRTGVWIFGVLFAWLAGIFLWGAPAYQRAGEVTLKRTLPDSSLLKKKPVKQKLGQLKSDIRRLERRLDAYLPHMSYIVINTTRNRFYLYDKKGKQIREGICSSGSYTKLVSEKKTWIFKTPKGRLTVLSKVENPVWTKPDWAFIEEGLPVPKPGDPSRYERGSLGNYALRMADGYLLHGTLYKRFLGMPVTHGCVRFGDEDLEVIYRTLPVGAYVYIY